MKTLHSESRFWNAPISSKLKKKNNNDIIVFRYDIIVIFWRCFISLVSFSYWSKFHINIITGSGIMTNFFYQGLTRNQEIGKNLVWVFPNIWRLVQVRDTTFDKKVSYKMLLNTAKCQNYSFYRFWVIKEKPTGGGWNYPSPPRLGLRIKSLGNEEILRKVQSWM